MSDCHECIDPLIFNARTNADFILPVRATDFTGATFSSKLKARDGVLVATFTIAQPSSVPTYTFDLRLTPVVLVLISPGTYFFDVLAVQGGVTTLLLEGQLVLVKGLT